MAGRHPVWSLLLRASALPSFGRCQSFTASAPRPLVACDRSLRSYRHRQGRRTRVPRPWTTPKRQADGWPPTRDQSLPASAAPVPAGLFQVHGRRLQRIQHQRCPFCDRFSSIIRRRELHPLKSSAFSRRTVTPTTGRFLSEVPTDQSPGWVVTSTALLFPSGSNVFFVVRRCQMAA
jgi:hypothetical protein